MTQHDQALLALLRALDARGYEFMTPAPNTQRRVLARRWGLKAGDLSDVFGWSMPFEDPVVGEEILELMRAGGVLAGRPGFWRSEVRVARIDGLLFLHSAFPPDKDAVFLGPDSYRFAEFIRAEAPAAAEAVIDIGAGAGVGGLFAGRRVAHNALTLTDVNPEALRLSAINAAFADQTIETIETDGLPPDGRGFDLILANPPYICGGAQTYSDGGEGLGLDVSLAWARAGAERLNPGGRMLLYTGAAMTRGEDPLRRELSQIAESAGLAMRYRELDPDVFPTTLLAPAYWGVERIAAVGCVLWRDATV